MNPLTPGNQATETSCHYNQQVCVGGFRPTIQDMYRTNSPHGLSLASAYFYGTLRDEENNLYVYMRNVGAESLHVVYLYYKTPGAESIVHPEASHFFRGMCVNRLRGDEIRIHSWRGIPGPGFSLTITTQAFHCLEENKMELDGKRIGLAMNVLFPQGGSDIYYSSIFYEVEGLLFGKKVKGGIGWDQVYGPPGENWQTMRPYHEIEIAWVSGINVYEDGEKEMYHVASGKGDWGWLFVTNNHDEIAAQSRSVKAEVKLDSDRYPAEVLFKTHGGDWIWIGEPDCHLNPKSQNLPLNWVEGQTRRVNEDPARRLISSVGWMEVFPDRI